MKYLLAGTVAIVLSTAQASADDAAKFDLTIQNHVWKPSELHIPAGKKALITVKNLDDSAEEFDSADLKVEKIIPANGEGTVKLHSLDAGRYSFTGEYHPETAHGVVIVE